MMKISSVWNLSLVLMMLLMVACDDFLEEDLEDKQIVVISPADQLQTTFSSQTFSWEAVDGADRYHLQIVSESFSNLNYFELDTNVSTTNYQHNLVPGNYQWRVNAFNNGSETPYVVRSLKIDSTNELTGLSITLRAPAGDFQTNDTLVGFSWDGLYNADSYEIEIRENDFNGALYYKDTLSGTDLVKGRVNFVEGSYGWGVRGLNDISSTNFNSRSFTVDLTAPTAPSITTTDTSQTSPFTINWNRLSSDVTYDSLYIYSNSNLTNVILNTEQSAAQYEGSLSTGTYYWRVKSIDGAGNIGAFSTAKRLDITQ